MIGHNFNRTLNSGYIFIWLYAIMAIVTFGHMWAKTMLLPVGPFPPELLIFKLILTAIASMFWPTYWSVWIWS